ncbi:MAG TPA: Hsp70 family protein [Kofleriaceae bacterium]|nr:Hsp70 family protein [Kofleriaceae bacterium]
MNDPIVGIDLGTSNTVVAHADDAGTVRVLADPSGYKIHPSVVSFHPNGGVVVGAAAKQRKVIDPKNTIFSIKRLIGRSFDSPEVQIAKQRMPYVIEPGEKGAPAVVTRAGKYAVPEISAIVLDYARGIAAAQLEAEVGRAVVTVPASFNDAQRSATATSGAIAGLTIVRVLNEPTAAALAYGHTRNLREVIAVYDFGGGTFDITLLRLQDQVYEVLGTAGDTFLGGDDLDERLVDRMVDKFLAENRVDLRQNEVSMMRLRAVAEQTKIELSRRSRAVVKIDEIAYGPRGKPLDLQIEITRDEFVSQVADIIDRTFPVCAEALKYAQLTTDHIDDVILVGGTTKIPYVRDQVTKFFAKAPRTDVNPEDAVAIGAALQASALDRVLKRGRVSRTTAARQAAQQDEETTAAGALILGDESMAGDTVTREHADPGSAPIDADRVIDELTLDTRPRPRQTADYAEIPAVRSNQEVRLERPVERGRHHDQFEERTPAPGSVPPQNAPGAAPLGRLARPATAPTMAEGAKTLPIGSSRPPPPPQQAVPQPVAPARTRAMPIPRPPAPSPAVPVAPAQAPTLMIESPGFAGARSDAERRGVSIESSGFAGARSDAERRGVSIESSGFAGARSDAERRGVSIEPSPAPPPSPASTSPGMGPAPGTTAPTLVVPPPSPAITAPGFAPPPPLHSAVTTAPGFGAPALPPNVGGYPVMHSPVVLDVTPRGLGIATVAGFCEELIRRNSRVPTEIRKLFTTSRDLQDAVRIIVVQGESRRMDQNVVIGDLRLENLPPRARGETSIEVTFALDASGILQVRARDAQTGREQRASLDVVGSMPAEDVAASRERLQSLRR